MRENKYKYITNSEKKKKQKKKNIFLFFVFLICVAIVLPLSIKIAIKIDEENALPEVIYEITTEEFSERYKEELTELTTKENAKIEETTELSTIITTEVLTVEMTVEATTEVSASETDADENDSIVGNDSTDDMAEEDSFTYSFGTITNGKIERKAYPSDMYQIYKYVVEEDEQALPDNDRGKELAFAIDEFIYDNISDSMSEYQKERAIHDYLVQNTTYTYVRKKEGYSSPKYTPYGALLDHKAVCQGYAEAFELMCACCNIKCYIVTGQATNKKGTEGHAWNIVEIDGIWYHVDVTWDDPIPEKYQNGISHEYFNVSDEFISTNHQWNEDDYPECLVSY